MSIVLQSSGGGSVTIQEPATASNFTQTLPAATGTVVLAGTTPTFNGITFPATQVPSADANTLDDYEEGTWSPSVTAGITSPTYNIQVGTYTKIGNVVTFTLRVAVSGGTRVGSLLEISLPFVGRNISSSPSSGFATWAYASGGVINSVTTNLPIWYFGPNTTTMYAYKTDGANFLGNDLATATPDIYLSGSFITNN